MNKYPHKCARCGLCCLQTPCPLAIDFAKRFSLPTPALDKPCDWLDYQKDGNAVCRLAMQIIHASPDEEIKIRKCFGIGAGCCIAGKAIDKTGKCHDLASIPPEAKHDIATAIIASLLEAAHDEN